MYSTTSYRLLKETARELHNLADDLGFGATTGAGKRLDVGNASAFLRALIVAYLVDRKKLLDALRSCGVQEGKQDGSLYRDD